jgi:hypothetical protein
VIANHYTGLKFEKQPKNGNAGSAPGGAEVRLVDDYGNNVMLKAVRVLLESSIIYPANSSAETNKDGIAFFTDLVAVTKGKYTLSARISHDHLACRDSAEFFQISWQEIARICNLRSVASTGKDNLGFT